MLRLKNFFCSWFPLLVWMILIFFLSSFHKLQASEIGWQDFVTRKTAHFLEYAILCFLFYRGFRRTTGFSLHRSLFFAFILTFLYALTDEYHQTWVSGRTGRFFDIGVDSLGAGFGAFFSWKLINLIPEEIRKILL